VKVTVKAYDDFGKPRAAAAATVIVGTASAKTDSHGVATLSASPGVVRVHAEIEGAVRSFAERVTVT
jgi:hypothetical protein